LDHRDARVHATLAFFAATGRSAPWGLNVGFVALVLNVVVLVIVTALMRITAHGTRPSRIG